MNSVTDRPKCNNCGIDIEGKKTGAKFCSPRCRVTFSRKDSVVTDNVTFSEPAVTDKFEFYTKTNDRDTATGKVQGSKSEVRTAKYWYDVPLAAIPVLQKGWPEIPVFETIKGEEPMNGRQYFLWWKNEFKMDGDSPVLHNPYPVYDSVTSVKAGDNSRHWGTN